jgi:hypothetical protein
MLNLLRKVLGASRFRWKPDVEFTDPRVTAALRTFTWS